jgi:hypothetical protein
MADYRDTIIPRAQADAIQRHAQAADRDVFVTLTKGRFGICAEAGTDLDYAAGDAAHAADSGEYLLTVLVRPNGTTCILDLTAHGDAIRAEEEADAALDRAHNRSLAAGAY